MLGSVSIVDHWKSKKFFRLNERQVPAKCSMTHYGLYLTQRHPARKRIGWRAQCKQTWHEHKRSLIWTSIILLSCFCSVNPSVSNMDSKMWSEAFFGALWMLSFCRNCHNVFLCFERSRIAAYQCILSLCVFVLCVFMHTEISNLLLWSCRKIDELSLDNDVYI